MEINSDQEVFTIEAVEAAEILLRRAISKSPIGEAVVGIVINARMRKSKAVALTLQSPSKRHRSRALKDLRDFMTGADSDHKV